MVLCGQIVAEQGSCTYILERVGYSGSAWRGQAAVNKTRRRQSRSEAMDKRQQSENRLQLQVLEHSRPAFFLLSLSKGPVGRDV